MNSRENIRDDFPVVGKLELPHLHVHPSSDPDDHQGAAASNVASC